MPTEQVLDASAFLAYLMREPGAEIVRPLLGSSAISTVNWSEVFQKARLRGLDTDDLRQSSEESELAIVDLGVEDAEVAAQLWPETRHLGLSLADRCCLALGQRLGATVITADRAWAQLAIGVAIQTIR